ncbi:nucleotide exchange factor GrpE [Tessaracoccus caeni]|uniref:nucleotide exchange factor GrpE n=1 Tax=Tessaracoccus caeni TaxID=3031239 RepID=UPI0029E7CBA6|nr:nucleotide exchange factor GrpE [Tessaracoccus caeni]
MTDANAYEEVEGVAADEAAAPAAPQEAAAPAEPEVDYAALVQERTADLQRLQAEYVNYKRRVDRDRDLSRQAGIEAVLLDLLPVLDSIELARLHDDLGDGFKMVADELAKVAGKWGLNAFGAKGEEFNPVKHEALMQAPLDEPVTVVTVSQVMQQGYELGGRVIRPARVAVANP